MLTGGSLTTGELEELELDDEWLLVAGSASSWLPSSTSVTVFNKTGLAFRFFLFLGKICEVHEEMEKEVPRVTASSFAKAG